MDFVFNRNIRKKLIALIVKIARETIPCLKQRTTNQTKTRHFFSSLLKHFQLQCAPVEHPQIRKTGPYGVTLIPMGATTL
ncbi:MAG: hypothetical protein AAGC95_03045 [Pseudomonadota bacterium]